VESPDRIAAGPVVLRRFTLADARDVQALVGDWDVARQLVDIVAHPYLDGMAEAWIGGHAHARATGGEHTFAITRATDGVLVGAIGMRPNGVHEHFGYWVGKPHWGHGYASASAQAVIDCLFRNTMLEAVWSTYLADNPASGRVMEKCGMIELHRETRRHRGAERPFIVRGITREAWRARPASRRADTGSV
jgi:RimJ/RimL family protein N-acetyltransferase